MAFSDLTELVLGACTATFGEDVTYTPVAGSSETVKAIFNETHVEIDGSIGIPVQSHEPNLGVRLSDLPADPSEGDTVVVRGTTYKVARWEDDGEGGSRLFLKKAS
jgi:hypothetical protein